MPAFKPHSQRNSLTTLSSHTHVFLLLEFLGGCQSQEKVFVASLGPIKKWLKNLRCLLCFPNRKDKLIQVRVKIDIMGIVCTGYSWTLQRTQQRFFSRMFSGSTSVLRTKYWQTPHGIFYTEAEIKQFTQFWHRSLSLVWCYGQKIQRKKSSPSVKISQRGSGYYKSKAGVRTCLSERTMGVSVLRAS